MLIKMTLTCQQIQSNILPEIWRSDGVVILPTDTLYGMTCRASSSSAVSKVYQLKKRPLDKLVPVLVDGIEMVRDYCGDKVDDSVELLLKQFWPGGLTIVLPVLPESPLGFMGSVGFRMPNSPYLLKAIKSFGEPIVGTSSNFSGEQSISNSEELSVYLSRLVVSFPEMEGVYFCRGDDDHHPSGMQSTVIKYNYESGGFDLIREGAIDFMEVSNFLK